jgi:nucleoside-diphosphate-sugar epimerase
LPLLSGFRVVGVDFSAAAPPDGVIMHSMNLGHESCCVQLVKLMRDYNVEAVVHLAFVIDPLRTGVLDKGTMWQINVAGTARVMEAITEVSRYSNKVRKFICPSSVSVYGPDTPPLVDESAPLKAHTLTYAMHKAEADAVVRLRANSLGECDTYLLRPHIFAGASVENYLVNAIRGRAFGDGPIARKMQRENRRLPLLLPSGKKYPQKLFQFVHVDDMARLIAWLLQRSGGARGELTVLNVAGSGPAISLARCAELAQAKVVRLPSRWACAKALGMMWRSGVSSVPPDAAPYMCGSYTMNTDRLRKLLGGDYDRVIRYSNEAALKDSFEDAEE